MHERQRMSTLEIVVGFLEETYLYQERPVNALYIWDKTWWFSSQRNFIVIFIVRELTNLRYFLFNIKTQNFYLLNQKSCFLLMFKHSRERRFNPIHFFVCLFSFLFCISLLSQKHFYFLRYTYRIDKSITEYFLYCTWFWFSVIFTVQSFC